MSKKDIYTIFNNVYNNFLLFGEVLCCDLVDNVMLKDWMKI